MKTTIFEERDNKGILGKSLMQDFTQGLVLAEFFEISEKAREGGMGDVFFCRDKRDNKFYVLKSFRNANKSKHLDEIEIFEKEAKFLLELGRHPNVVYAKTLVHHRDKYYLVMDFVGKQPYTIEEKVEGETLTRVLSKTKIEPKQALIWAIQFCRGMQFLHKSGMKVHKDIKPDNILITPENNIKIADFGLAGLDKKGGTIGYRAPEYFKEGEKLTIQSDIYSFGLVLYQMLNGGKSLPNATIWDEKTKEYEKIDINSIQSEHCLEIIKKCLAGTPSYRYKNFKNLEKSLTQYMEKCFPEYHPSSFIEEKMSAEDFFWKGLGFIGLSCFSSSEDEMRKMAINFLNLSIKKDPKYAHAYYQRAKLLISSVIFSPFQEDYFSLTKEDKVVLKQYLADCRKASVLDPFFANLIAVDKYTRRYEEQYGGIFEYRDLKNIYDDLSRAIKKFPRNWVLHNNMGCLSYDLGNIKNAIKEFSWAIKRNPTACIVYANRAKCYLQINKEKEAFEDLESCVSLQRTSLEKHPFLFCAGVYFTFLDHYCQIGKYEQIYAWYKKQIDSIRLENPDQKAFVLDTLERYILKHKLKNFPHLFSRKEGLKSYRRLFKHNLDKKFLRFFLRETVVLQLNRKHMPIMGYDRELIYHRCLYTHPTAENFNEMGCFQAKYRNLSADWAFYDGEEYLKEICSRAIPYFSQAIKLNPQYTPALLNRAYAYAILGEYKLAISDYNKALDLNPDQYWGAESTRRMSFLSGYMRPVSDTSGWTSFSAMKKRAEKIKNISTTEYIAGVPIFSTKLKYEKGSGELPKPCGNISFHRAGLYAMMGKYTKSLELLKEPLKLGHPEKGELLYLMGKCYYALKNYEKAVEAYEDVLKQEYFTKRDFVLIRLAKIYYLLGQKDLGKQKLVEFFICRGIKNPEEIVKRIKNNIRDIESLLSISHITFIEGEAVILSESDYTHDFVKNPHLYGRFDAYVERGNCYFSLQNYEKALEDYEIVLNRRIESKKMLFNEAIEIDESINYLKDKIKQCEERIKEMHKK